MWANNVTGAFQPIPEIAAICAARRSAAARRRRPGRAGACRSDFAAAGADTMAALGAQAGRAEGRRCAGRAATRRGIPPLIWGGGQEGGRRSGTENVAGAVGFAAALEQAPRSGRRRMLRDRLESGLPEGSTVVSADAGGCPATRCCCLPACAPSCWRWRSTGPGSPSPAGSACASGDQSPSHVLIAQGMSPADAAA